ncbi:hypothetical protein ACQCVB_19745 [Fictibacillus phosphorivorans]|uniref:hypothetical protein n=1 Tax=Fictibacillus phosphorivorans TaxID=1221500 RepID=UPI003CF0F756
MKNYLLGIMMIILLTGCGVKEEPLDEMLRMISEDTELTEHLSSVTYDLSEENGYEDDLTGELLTSFDRLTPEEQNLFFDQLNKVAVQNNGEPEQGSFFCGIDYECTINDIILRTKDHTYRKMYSDDGDMFPEFYKDDELVYDANEKDDLPVTETEVVEPVEETEEETLEEPAEVIEELPTIDIATADGNDWLTLSSDEKYSLIDEALSNIKSHGTVVSAEADWFVEALDAFYGDEMTNSTLVSEAIAMSGVAGGVIE